MNRSDPASPSSSGTTAAPRSLDGLMDELYDELRALARQALRQERPQHTLQPTALAHEAWLRLSRQRRADWHNRAYVLAAAAAVIRRVLVDHGRARSAAKRGGGWTVRDLGVDELTVDPQTRLVELHDALEALAGLDARQARVVELRVFAGLGVDDVASVLGVSPRTVANDWRVALAWLRLRLATDA